MKTLDTIFFIKPRNGRVKKSIEDFIQLIPFMMKGKLVTQMKIL